MRPQVEAFAPMTASCRVWWWLCHLVELVSLWSNSLYKKNKWWNKTCNISPLPKLLCDRCQWNGLIPWSQQLWLLLSQEVMPAKKHAVWVCNISAVSTLWGPQSVPDDMGQHPVPEEPGLVPDPVTVWEDDTRATLKESQVFTNASAVMTCKGVAGLFNLNGNKSYWSAAISSRGGSGRSRIIQLQRHDCILAGLNVIIWTVNDFHFKIK